jgi:hypothetical protein
LGYPKASLHFCQCFERVEYICGKKRLKHFKTFSRNCFIFSDIIDLLALRSDVQVASDAFKINGNKEFFEFLGDNISGDKKNQEMTVFSRKLLNIDSEIALIKVQILAFLVFS